MVEFFFSLSLLQPIRHTLFNIFQGIKGGIFPILMSNFDVRIVLCSSFSAGSMNME